MISQTPLTILLVDDSTADRTLYRHFLSSTGTYTFLEAATGEEGLRLCQTTQPDCLILDFYLPDMDGFEFLDTLQAETVSLPYPVVILTGQGTEQLAVQAMHRGVQDYVVKDDLSADTLRRVIANAVDKFRLQQMLKTHRSLLQEQNLALRQQEEALQTLNATLAQQVAERTALLELLQAITAAANEATSPRGGPAVGVGSDLCVHWLACWPCLSRRTRRLGSVDVQHHLAPRHTRALCSVPAGHTDPAYAYGRE